MTPPPDSAGPDWFGHALERTTQVQAEAERLLADAEQVFAPGPPLPAPANPRRARRSRADHLLDFIWVVASAVGHLAFGLVLCGSVLLVTVLLAALVWVLIDRHFGVPLTAATAACLGLLVAGSTVAEVVRSFRRSLSQCPW
jgi:hypothetical protein